MRRAIDLLPPEMKPFFEHFRDEVVVRVDRPRPLAERRLGRRSQSLRRSSATRCSARFPSPALPREYGAAIEKFGMAALKRIGLLPWREAEEFGNLRRAFEGFAKNSPYATERRRAVRRRRVALHPGRPSAVPRDQQLRWPADGQQRHPRALRARSVRALRIASGRRLRLGRSRSPTRATPHSRSSWPAISWWTRSCRPTRTPSRERTSTTPTTTRCSSRRSGRRSSSSSRRRSRRRPACSSVRGSRPAGRR